MAAALLLAPRLGAQQPPARQMLLVPTDAKASVLERLDIATSRPVVDSLEVASELRRSIGQLQANAYLEASVDSLQWGGDAVRAFLHLGPRYEWAVLENGNVPTDILDRVGFQDRLFRGKPFHYSELRNLQEKLLQQAENNGHPFAMAWLDSLRLMPNGGVYARLFLDAYREISIEQIRIEGDAKIQTAYLENYLEIPLGSAYNQARIKDIPRRLRDLPFVEMERPPQISFRGDAATITLFLKKKKASQFDFILGFLPRNTTNTPEESKRLLVTVSLNANAQNLLGAGERIHIKFQQLQPLTQQLDLQGTYPYVLGWSFGVDGKFALYKRDTSYLDLESDLGVQYLLGGTDYLKAFWNKRGTTILSVDADRILQQMKLPDRLDTSYSSFGLEYNRQRLDYRFNPRKGWAALLRGAAGYKNIEKNSRILSLRSADMPQFDPESLYDSLQLRTFQYQLSAKGESYVPIQKRSVLKFGVNGGAILSKTPVYANELFRIGGNKLLRGFDEEAISASSYLVGTLEYRFIIGTNSYLYVFGDYAYLQSKTVETSLADRPLGLGAGVTFETRAGVFGLSYAIGKRLGNPFDFRAAKIHFGYVSYF
jgi:outer membrane protein assembly factor BamA